MIAEILAVGTELLMGQIANTNAQFLSERLNALGCNVYHHVTVGDNPARMRACMAQALERADLLITTGGLGPTDDDITKETLAELLGLPLIADEQSIQKLKDTFAARGAALEQANLKQGFFPKGARILRNARGTAPGCCIVHNGKTIAVLPGPPFEMRAMFDDALAPILRETLNESTVSRYARIMGMGESAVALAVRDLMNRKGNPTLAPYITDGGEVLLRLSAHCACEREAAALLDPLEAEVRARLGDAIYAVGESPLPQVLVRELCEKGLRVAFAESCTGGLAAARLVDVAGASACFLEGVVTYSNQAKMRRLGVLSQTLETYGAVSEQTAREMAENLLAQSGADLALSITGIAGPDGGTAEKPVGLVWFGVATRSGTMAHERRFYNNGRERIRINAAAYGLYLLLRKQREMVYNHS